MITNCNHLRSIRLPWQLFTYNLQGKHHWQLLLNGSFRNSCNVFIKKTNWKVLSFFVWSDIYGVRCGRFYKESAPRVMWVSPSRCQYFHTHNISQHFESKYQFSFHYCMACPISIPVLLKFYFWMVVCIVCIEPFILWSFTKVRFLESFVKHSNIWFSVSIASTEIVPSKLLSLIHMIHAQKMQENVLLRYLSLGLWEPRFVEGMKRLGESSFRPLPSLVH